MDRFEEITERIVDRVLACDNAAVTGLSYWRQPLFLRCQKRVLACLGGSLVSLLWLRLL